MFGVIEGMDIDGLVPMIHKGSFGFDTLHLECLDDSVARSATSTEQVQEVGICEISESLGADTFGKFRSLHLVLRIGL